MMRAFLPEEMGVAPFLAVEQGADSGSLGVFCQRPGVGVPGLGYGGRALTCPGFGVFLSRRFGEVSGQGFPGEDGHAAEGVGCVAEEV